MIEKVLVASNNKRLPKAKIACIRLVQEDEAGSAQQGEAINVPQGTPDVNLQMARIASASSPVQLIYVYLNFYFRLREGRPQIECYAP